MALHCTTAQKAGDGPGESPNLQIWHGDDAEKGEFPFMVRLLAEGEHTCGGSLINKKVVLTAAHCMLVNGNIREGISVVVGDWSSESEEENEQTLKTVRTIVHPMYSEKAFDYDIALLILEKEVEISKTVDIISLPEDRKLYEEGTPVTIAGWGEFDESKEIPPILQKHVYEVSNKEECAAHWEKQQVDVTEDMMCAGNPPIQAWAFSGDSGGPVFSKQTDKFVLLGATSWGTDQPTNYTYDISADVHFFKGWIEDNMGMGLNDQWVELSGGDYGHGIAVFHNKEEEYTMCSHGAGDEEAELICKHMGFKTGVMTSALPYHFRTRREQAPSFPDVAKTQLDCDSEDESVWKCDMKEYPGEANTPCFKGQELAVQCFMEEWEFEVVSMYTKYKEKDGHVRGKVMCSATAMQNGMSVDMSEIQMSLMNVAGKEVNVVVEDMKYKKRAGSFMGKIKSQDKVSHNCFVCVAAVRDARKFFTSGVERGGCKEEEEDVKQAVKEWMEKMNTN